MRHFRLEEFRCPCGCLSEVMHQDFLLVLDQARELAGVPFQVSSGFRCIRHNRKVGGSSGSLHVQGRAADLTPDNSTSTAYWRGRALYGIMNAALDLGGCFDVVLYPTHLHLELDKLGERAPVAVYLA